MDTSKPLLDSKEKTIDDIQVRVTMFPGLRGLKLKGRLLKIVGPALGKAIKAIDGKTENLFSQDIDMGAVGEALSSLTEKLDDPGVTELILDLLKSTTADNKEVDKNYIDFDIAGKYTTLYKMLLFGII